MFTRALFLDELELETRVFYCGFSLYQPQVCDHMHTCMLACTSASMDAFMQDEHPDGLTINEQLAQDPFTEIIHLQPKHGMVVIHTTLAEVYVRMWYAPPAFLSFFFYGCDGWLGGQVCV